MKIDLIRLCGLAAVFAGVLRVINSFIPNTTPQIMLLYFLTDFFILLGSVGIYHFAQKQTGSMVMVGFILQVIGALILITRDVAFLGSRAYSIGALTFAVGLDLLAIGSWSSKRFPRWILIFWVLSTILGLVGNFIPATSLLFMVAGVLFGLAFAGTGMTVLFNRHNDQKPLRY